MFAPVTYMTDYNCDAFAEFTESLGISSKEAGEEGDE